MRTKSRGTRVMRRNDRRETADPESLEDAAISDRCSEGNKPFLAIQKTCHLALAVQMSHHGIPYAGGLLLPPFCKGFLTFSLNKHTRVYMERHI